MRNTISVGTDPEFVVKNRDGVPISAPHALNVPNVDTPPKTKTRFGEIFADNANVEFSVEYGKTKQELQDNIRGCIQIAKNIIGPDLNLYAIPSLEYSRSELNHPLCAKFGCEPDYDAFQLRENVIAKKAVKSPFRTCGGHVHLGNMGADEYLQDFDGQIETVRTFELLAGIPSLLLDNTPESIKRRQLYGGCSAHRIKPYGVECRSLSNYWTQTPELVGFIFDVSQLVATEMRERNLKSFDKNVLPSIINAGNVEAARSILRIIQDSYPELRTGYEAVSGMANMNKNIPLTETWNI